VVTAAVAEAAMCLAGQVEFGARRDVAATRRGAVAYAVGPADCLRRLPGVAAPVSARNTETTENSASHGGSDHGDMERIEERIIRVRHKKRSMISGPSWRVARCAW
jgi:hypothetical protein